MALLEEKDINFLVSYRDRERMLSHFVKSIHKFYPESKIIIAEQCDDKPFLQGQLLNLAYKYSTGKIVVFMDVDVRFRKKLDILEIVPAIDHPFLAYNDLWHCDMNGRVVAIRKGSDSSNGGCCIFTREQFEASSGYSNLIVGWGGDDDILNGRVGGFVRLENVMLHVRHPRLKRGEIYEGNLHAYKTDDMRDKHLDGFRQTTARLLTKQDDGNKLHLCFDNIGVVSDFAYPELVRDAYVCK